VRREEGVVLVGEVGAERGGDGVGEGEGRCGEKRCRIRVWARTRHVSLGGEEPRDMLAYVDQ
jgi:hypothetical protein